MKLQSTPIDGLFILERNNYKDFRGVFSRLYAKDELQELGVSASAFHVNLSVSWRAGCLRGIHFQYPPHSETKIVACVTGAVWDVAVDLRLDSPTRFGWFGTTLTPANGRSLIVPDGFGHAILALEDNSTAVYANSAPYQPGKESGIRFDDPLLGIEWPLPPLDVSEKDLSWGLLSDRKTELDEGFGGAA